MCEDSNSEPTTLTGTFTAILSGLICGILAVTFNVVKALLTFDAILQIAPIGIGCHVTTIVAGLGAAFFQRLSNFILGGPNIKHALLLSPMVIQPMICRIDPALPSCANTDLTGNSGSSSGRGRRALLAAGGGNSTNFATGVLTDTQEVILATCLFAMFYTTLIFSLLWYIIGKYKLTRILQFLPSFVTSGFIASCGYLIITKAIFVSTNMHFSVQINHFDVKHTLEGKFWYLLLPAFLWNVDVLVKHFRVGKVMYMVPLVLICSTLLFFITVYASGNNVSTARDGGWFYQSSLK